MKDAIELMRERAEMVEQIERETEMEYELSTMRKEAVELKRAIDTFLLRKGKSYEDDKGKFTLVQPQKGFWNPDRLRELVKPNLFFKLCKLVPDSDAIEDAIREGKIERKKIESAYELHPLKPFVKHTPKDTEKASKRKAQADKVKAVLNG